jgi:large subunit ribosomal protein L33
MAFCVARYGRATSSCPHLARILSPRCWTLNRVVEMPRDKIILACGECKNRNYFTTKNKRLHPERVEWKKYCPRCNKHQVHKETK